MTCPRCGEASCSDPDSKACSDNCIGRLQRQLALAQTEIKGHMRVEDELKEKVAELESRIKVICHRNSPCACTFDEDDNLVRQCMAHAEIRGADKARIAELEKAIVGECEDCGQMILTPLHPLPSVEKDAARYRWLRNVRARKEYRIDGWEGAMWSVEGLHDPDEKGFDAAIDAALKDRV